MKERREREREVEKGRKGGREGGRKEEEVVSVKTRLMDDTPDGVEEGQVKRKNRMRWRGENELDDFQAEDR